MRQFDQLPEEVQPLRLDVNRVMTGVVLVMTGLWTWATFGEENSLLLASTLPIAAGLLNRASKAKGSGLVLWCCFGGALAGWVNASVGGALVLGIEALPWTLCFGFLGVPHGIAYGTSYLVLLAPIRRLAASADAPERALAMIALWMILSALFLLLARLYAFPFPAPFMDAKQPVSVASLRPLVIAVASVGLLFGAFVAWRLLRRQRWIDAVKRGRLPGYRTLEVEPSHRALPWLVSPREPALVIARQVEIGAYRSSEPQPLALVAAVGSRQQPSRFRSILCQARHS